jgi:hypothetical protein
MSKFFLLIIITGIISSCGVKGELYHDPNNSKIENNLKSKSNS